MIQQTESFQWKRIQENNFISWVNTKIEPLIKEFWWYSFNNGVFRIHTYASSIKWKNIIEEYFSNINTQIFPFWFDRMWRQFAINLNNEKEIHIFDCADNWNYVWDEDLNTFLLNMIKDTEWYLSEDEFKEFNTELKFNQSISHKIPLILWGKDEIDNMEVCDMEVDWGIVWQIHQQVK